MDIRQRIQKGNIVLEEVIAAKNPRLFRVMPRWLLAYLKRIIHVDEMNAVIAKLRGVEGVDFAERVLEEFGVEYSVEGLEKVPRDGRYIFASNHPLGGMDGMVLISIFGRYFEKIYFPVNDILTLLPQFSSIFLPINKHGAQSQEGAARLNAAYASDAQMLYFPAGLCSRKRGGKIADLEWKSNFVSKAIEYQRDVVPLFFEGRNTNFFYNLSRLRIAFGIKSNIEMLYLVDEMYKQRGAKLRVHVGEPLAWQELHGHGKSRREVASWIRKRAYSLHLPVKQRSQCKS